MTATNSTVLKGCAVKSRLRRFLANSDDSRPADFFAGWRPADIANILGGFSAGEAARVLMVLPPRQRAAIIVFFDPATRLAIARHFPARQREDMVVRADRLVRRRSGSASQGPVNQGQGRGGVLREGGRPTDAGLSVSGRSVSGWATGVALNAATGILRRGHRMGVISPHNLARGLIRVAGWRGRLRRKAQEKLMSTCDAA